MPCRATYWPRDSLWAPTAGRRSRDLEAVSKPSSGDRGGRGFRLFGDPGGAKFVGAEDAGSQVMKGLEVLPLTLITEVNTAEMSPPTHGPLHHPTLLAQAAAVRLALAPRRQQRGDAIEHHDGDQVDE